VVSEALARRERAGMAFRTDLATILPYDLQREVFEEVGRIHRRARPAQQPETPRTPDQPDAESPDHHPAPAGGPLGWMAAWMPLPPWLGGRDPAHRAHDDKELEPPDQIAATVGVTSANAVAGDDFDSAASAATAFATASALADQQKMDRFLSSQAAVDLKRLVARARLVASKDDAREFVDDVGVGPLVFALRTFQGPEQAVAVSALAQIAVLVPSARLEIVTCDSASVLDSLVQLLSRENRPLVGPLSGWQTEALVSATHLIGSLALCAGSEGKEWRRRMATHSELCKSLEYLSRGLKVGESESAARAARRALAALGINKWRPRVPGQRGLRILSLDGGGTRAVMSFEMLKHLKRITGSEIHELFDIIAGTSTGAIIAGSLGIRHKTVEEVETLYRDLIGRVFAKHPVNMTKMIFTRAYYDTSVLESVLKRECGTGLFFDSTADPSANKVVVVSSIMSRNPKELHVFRNYTYPCGVESRYGGTTEAEIWEGLRASSAAPTFFSEIRVNGELHADGAIVANNPTAVALHEAKCIYPGVPVEVLVSIGNGKAASGDDAFKDSVGWNDVLGTIIDSATSTEFVHHTLQDLLPPNQYFRFNPSTQHTAIDETDPGRLAYWVARTHEHIEAERDRFEELGAILRPQTPRNLWNQLKNAVSHELTQFRDQNNLL